MRSRLTIAALTLLCAMACDDAAHEGPTRRAATTGQARGHIDMPVPDSIVPDSFVVSGWAVSPAGVRAVRVYLDDKIIGTLKLTVPRPDVEQALPRLAPAGVPHGFSGWVEAGDTIGFAKLSIEVIDKNDALSRVFNVNVNVQP
jgi:hypothetical protein